MKMKTTMIVLAAATMLSASAEMRSITPASRTDNGWMGLHQKKLGEIAANSNRTYDVVFVGDSIVGRWEQEHKSRWTHWFKYGKIRALNLGFGGDRTEHALWRVANGELDGYKAKAIVLALGVNNVTHFSVEEEPSADVLLGMFAVIRAIQAKQPQARLIVNAILPCGRDANDPRRRRCAVVNRQLARICNDHSLVWFDPSRCFLTADGRLPRRLMPDYVHPSDEGYDVWASALMPLLREICFIGGGINPPFPKYRPEPLPDWEFSDLPPEAIGDTRITGVSKNREDGPFGDCWWANRLHNRREQVRAAKGKTVDVVFMGDSIMHFWEWRHPESWKKFTSRHSAINCGYGGDRTQDVLWRAENGELDGYEAKCVVLMIGTNNSTLGSRAEDIAVGIRECLAAIRRKQPKARIVLHPIFPRGWDTPESRKSHEKERANNEKANALIRSFADGKDVIWIDFNAKWTPDGWGVPKELMADAIHPTDAGYDLWMSELIPTVDRLCGR